MTERDDNRTHSAAPVKTEDEITNVDLQFMGGQQDKRNGQNEQLDMQDVAPGEHRDLGLNKQDVASLGSMITSDPASTTPGEETSLSTKDDEV
ncbi:M-like protein [Deinococcus sp. S9]|uniref:M-like protein n=1 Tax=Deinococcus sp. S9 TaxID=2545754 RepID=UPI001055A9C9|nr:M-like protein [Deinococcus sp. S9]TDE87066.1 M-like protein [Deinococcus sp. S9]